MGAQASACLSKEKAEPAGACSRRADTLPAGGYVTSGRGLGLADQVQGVHTTDDRIDDFDALGSSLDEEWRACGLNISVEHVGGRRTLRLVLPRAV